MHNTALLTDTSDILKAIADITANILPVDDMSTLSIDESLPELDDEE